MAFNYLAAHQRMIREAVKTRGGDFGALYDISRWHGLTPAESDKLAQDVGIVLSAEQREELRARWEEAEAADALALGRAERDPESLPVRWIAEDQEHEPRQPVVVRRAVTVVYGVDVAKEPDRHVVAEVSASGLKVIEDRPSIKRIDFNRKKT